MGKTIILSSSQNQFKNHPIHKFVEDLRDEVFNRLVGKNPDTQMHIWDNWDAAINPTTYDINPDFWCPDLVSQLTGVPVYTDQGWYQSAGGTVITPRHVVMVTHGSQNWGPNVGNILRYANPVTAEVFETTIIELVAGSQAIGNIALVSDVFPSWVNKFPFINLSPATSQFLQSSELYREVPFYAVSQGNVLNTYSDINARTPKNMKFYLKSSQGITSYGSSVGGTLNSKNGGFGHSLVSGDSGRPSFILRSGILHLVNCNDGPIIDSLDIQRINQGIVDADLQAIANNKLSELTGYTVTVALDPLIP